MISAVVFAAGRSVRMGQPKMILPWGKINVIGQVIHILLQSSVDEILVVTGSGHEQVEQALQGLPVRLVYNTEHEKKEMLSSAQAGLGSLGDVVGAALFVLGDQPQIELEVVERVLAEYRKTEAPLVVPSYQMRRGHPWILDRSLWPSVFNMEPPESLRDLVRNQASSIHYVTVDTPTVIQDLDTPQDYQQFRPPHSENIS
jgi:molybdenum cofactor cytidylyltransferase